VAVIPGLIALGEKQNVTGIELIEGLVVGYEILARVAKGMNPSHLNRGYHTTGTVGPFGAAAACSKILRLNRKATKNALAIAGLQGSGLLEVMESGQMMKPLHPAKASQAGVLAALLAKEGAEGPVLIFEGDKGFLKAFAEGCDLDGMVKDLGNGFEIMRVYFKLHAACRHIHPSIDAIIEIMNRDKIAIDEIERIVVNTYSIAHRLTGQNNEADTELAAKFNLPVSVALVLIYGRAGVDEYSIENMRNPLVRKLAKKVTIEVDKKRDMSYPNKRGASVRIKTSKGSYSYEVDNAKGESEFPFSDHELNDKFIQNAKKVLPIEKINKLQEIICNIEKKQHGH
jgi:2-methylcitrate dehydratase PrpD